MLSPEILNLLKQLDIKIDSNTVFLLTPLFSQDNSRGETVGETLTVVNHMGNMVKTNTIFVFGEEGVMPLTQTDSSYQVVTYPFSNGGLIAVNSSGLYNQYIQGSFVHFYYAQPIAVNFTYTKLLTTADVQYIEDRYFCFGEVYSLPDLIDQDYVDGYTIFCTKYSPVPYILYSTASQCSFAMWLNGLDAVGPGQYIYTKVIVNGVTYHGTSMIQHQ